MDCSKIVTKEDVELETLKKFLSNQFVGFDKNLIDQNKTEPTDIRYNGTNYQITEGDKKNVQSLREVTSKRIPFSAIRDVSNIAEILLRRTLEKKSIRSDKQTILLIDTTSTGGRDWDSLEREVSTWATNNFKICNCWREIYLVYRGRNIKLLF